MEKEKIALSIEYTEEEVQEFAESNCDRELTNTELHRLRNYWHECSEIDQLRMDILYTAINHAMDDKKSDWSEVDTDYLKSKGKKVSNP